MTDPTPGTAIATASDPLTTDRPTRIVSVIPYAYWPIAERWGYARSLAHAGDMIPSGLRVVNDIEATTARVFLVLETGAMLGLHPMAALNGIDVIKGTAALSPELFTGLARAAGMKLRIVEEGTIEDGNFAVTAILIRPDDDEPIVSRFSMKDALRAELIDRYAPPAGSQGDFVVVAKSDNWRKYPADMCQWRAVGRLARRGGADVTKGIGYFPEELEVLVNEEGTHIDMRPMEDELIAEFEVFDDKADMAEVWKREHPDGVATQRWTARVDASFTAHLSKCTKDSRPPKDGAPGQTGDPDVDGPKQITGTPDDEPVFNPHDAQPSDYDDARSDGQGGTVSATHEREKREYDEAHAVPIRTVEEAAAVGASLPAAPEVEDIDARVAREEREEAERSRAEHAAYLAEQERAAAAATPAPPQDHPVAQSTVPPVADVVPGQATSPLPPAGLDMSALERPHTEQ